jgi:hypothetical protein
MMPASLNLPVLYREAAARRNRFDVARFAPPATA